MTSGPPKRSMAAALIVLGTVVGTLSGMDGLMMTSLAAASARRHDRNLGIGGPPSKESRRTSTAFLSHPTLDAARAACHGAARTQLRKVDLDLNHETRRQPCAL